MRKLSWLFLPFKERASGMSLIMVVIGLAVMGILVPIIFQLQSSQFATLRRASEEGELEDVRNYFRQNISCIDSFGRLPIECQGPGGYIPIQGKGVKKPVIIERPTGSKFTRLGKTLALRAWCGNQSGKKFMRIEVNRLSADGKKALPDRSTNLLLDGTVATSSTDNTLGWKDLFRGTPVCVLP